MRNCARLRHSEKKDRQRRSFFVGIRFLSSGVRIATGRIATLAMTDSVHNSNFATGSLRCHGMDLMGV